MNVEGNEITVSVPAGATEVEVTLPPGVHDMCLQFADADGVTYYGVDDITLRVTAGASDHHRGGHR